jgi:uncharacterized membrane protein
MYGIYALFAVLQFSFASMVAGSGALLVAVGFAYLKKKEAAGTPFESHLTWLIRTFWIGTGVYLPLLTLADLALLISKVDIDSLMSKVSSGEIAGADELEALLMSQYGGATLYMTIAFTVPFLVWWLWRCWTGFHLLKEDKPIQKPLSWL